MKDAYYFSHDANASSDPKISAMMSKYGYEGYGWYWRLLEILREQPGYKYPMNKYTYDTFAKMFYTTKEKICEFISDCCHEFADSNKGLFVTDDQYFYSESFISRMSLIDEKRDMARVSANKRWDGSERNANAMRTHNERNANAMQGKERKGKERKDIAPTKTKNEYAPLVTLTDDEHCKLTEQHGAEAVKWIYEKLSSYKLANGKTYKSDYGAINTWVVDAWNKAKPSVRTGGTDYGLADWSRTGSNRDNPD
jgi:hypothetical protein